MPFPVTNRVFYTKNPLVEVVCQLRFPPVLRIDSELPSAFQDRIRDRFPEYQSSRPQLPAGLNLPAELAKVMFANAQSSAHEFITADGSSRISLTRDFIALSVNNYSQWANFFELLKGPLEALTELYRPSYFSRIGLRYRDRIERERLNLGGVPWHELIQPWIAGALADETIAPQVERILGEVNIKLPEGGAVRIVHGLDGETDKLAYLIDSDFYREGQVPTGEVDNVLRTFNQKAGHLFRWCIKPKLDAAMEPRDP